MPNFTLIWEPEGNGKYLTKSVILVTRFWAVDSLDCDGKMAMVGRQETFYKWEGSASDVKE